MHGPAQTHSIFQCIILQRWYEELSMCVNLSDHFSTTHVGHVGKTHMRTYSKPALLNIQAGAIT